MLTVPSCININKLECKFKSRYYLCYDELCININKLECKL